MSETSALKFVGSIFALKMSTINWAIQFHVEQKHEYLSEVIVKVIYCLFISYAMHAVNFFIFY